MAVTSLWRIKGRISKVIDYAANPRKTENPVLGEDNILAVIMGKKPHELEADEIPEILREAIFQEEAVAQVDSLDCERSDGRGLLVAFTGTLTSGSTINTEVSTNL